MAEGASGSKGPLGLNLLYEPPDPRIDFIFIHGLGGGSRKSWCYSSEPGMFWPQDWLREESGFEHARIHSYGYNSAWTGRDGSQLAIDDFAQSFLADVSNSPRLQRNGTTSIVTVAHSMGGLVAKKAYLLANKDPNYKDVAKRMHSMYFLATPHRGADSAQLGKLLLAVSLKGSKPFLEDLIPGSRTLEAINNEFERACGSIKLWSFFESQTQKFGLTSSLVVSRDSAVIGLPGERVQYLEADHRHMCKFRGLTDPNYLILRNAFSTTIKAAETDAIVRHRFAYQQQMMAVASILGVDQRPEADFLAVAEKQHPGSCQWLTERRDFHNWTAGSPDLVAPSSHEKARSPKPKILWLKGPLGTGKSVAAAHVIKYLQSSGIDCSFYFFRHDDESRSTVSSLLRSLAFQMAETNPEIRQAIASMSTDEERIDENDHRMLWQKIFFNTIFKLKFSKPHIWIVDALDESSSGSVASFIQMLSQIDDKIPLRIFVTSRPVSHMESFFIQKKLAILEICTGQAGTLSDIEVFLKAQCRETRDAASYDHFIGDVVSKSNGIFLWVSLATTRLMDAYSLEDMQNVLLEIPSEMNDLYSRTLDAVLQSPSAEIAKCVFKWTICSPKRLTLSELVAAIKLDIHRTIDASPSELETLCGNLIFIKQSRVQVAHESVSAFLQQNNIGFAINIQHAHSRLAEVCLNLLCGREFAHPRPKTRLVESGSQASQLPLAHYACLNYSYHLAHSAASEDTILAPLNKFLNSNVLTWVEILARGGDLPSLIQTAQRLEAYVSRREEYDSSFATEVQSIQNWAYELTYLAATFGSHLLDCPSAIYVLVPMLCPPMSTMNKLFAKYSKRIKLSGAIEQNWSRRLRSFSYPSRVLSITCSNLFLAIGLSSGEANIYDSDSLEHVATLLHGQSVRQLAFSSTDSLLASCSARQMRLWNVRRNEQTCLWKTDLDVIALGIAFSPDGTHLLLPNNRGSTMLFDVAAGNQIETLPLIISLDPDSSDDSEQESGWVIPSRIRLDSTQKIAALSYRNSTVILWYLEENEKYGKFEKEGFEGVYVTAPVVDMVFSPDPALELLAIAYDDGDIVICNPWTLEQISVRQQAVDTLAVTSDNRILAGGDVFGVVHLFAFETLHLLCRISTLDAPIRQIVFSPDNSRLFDIRDQSCNAWNAFIVSSKDGTVDEGSASDTVGAKSEELAMTQPVQFEWGNAITTTVETSDGAFIFAGRQDGAIDIYDLKSGKVTETLHLHDTMTDIKHIYWDDSEKLLLSIDLSNRCILSRVSLPCDEDKRECRRLFDWQEAKIVSGVLLGPDTLYLLVSEPSVKLMTKDGIVVAKLASTSACTWMTHPTNPDYILKLQGKEKMQVFNWSNLEECVGSDDLFPALAALELFDDSKIVGNLTEGFEWISHRSSSYVVRWPQRRHNTRETLQVSSMRFDIKNTTTTHVAPVANWSTIDVPNIATVISLFRSTLFFLDNKGWICSVSLKTSKENKFYQQHFFIPPTWQDGDGASFVRVVSKDSAILVRGNELVVFHGFLDFQRNVPF